MNNSYVFGKLYARPSLIEGMSRNMDIFNTLRAYNESPTEAEADITALKNDWRAVGDDLRSSISNYEHKLAR